MGMIDRGGFRRLCCLAALFACMPAAAAGGESTDMPERRSGAEQADALTYQVAIMEGAGWQRETVDRAIAQVEAIYAQCDVRVAAADVCWRQMPGTLKTLDESEQADLLAKLPRERPLAVFVDRTTTGDTAYAYRMSAPVASRGTAWITRKSHLSCLGVLLAHELGHILLDTANHSADPKNLMAYTCTHSNIAGSTSNTRLSESQCRRLRALQ